MAAKINSHGGTLTQMQATLMGIHGPNSLFGSLLALPQMGGRLVVLMHNAMRENANKNWVFEMQLALPAKQTRIPPNPFL